MNTQTNAHWTERSTEDFVYRISSDFALQIEKKMDADQMRQGELADKLRVTDGRVSQVLRNPGNFTLKKMVEYARAVDMKVAVVAYQDDDPDNKNGPINSEVFNSCWEQAGKPMNFFSLQQNAIIYANAPLIQYVSNIGNYEQQYQTMETDSVIVNFDLLAKKLTSNLSFIHRSAD